MALDDFGQWNEDLQSAGVPLEIHSKPRKNNPIREPFEDLGIVELRVLPGISPKSGTEPVSSRLVHAVFVADVKALRDLLLQVDKVDLVFISAITPRLADELRERGIMFVDKRGNCFVSWPGILIDTRGKIDTTTLTRKGGERESSQKWAKQRTASLFTPRRAQISAVLLSSPSLLQASVREVAREAGVSVGTANKTLVLLTEAGYLRRTRAGYRVENVDTFLEAWAHAYPTGLGADLQMFRGTGDLGRLADLKPLGWTSGELAVPGLVRGGHTAHLYVEDMEDITTLIRTARLRRDETGEVTIRLAFWPRPDHLRIKSQQPSLPSKVNGPLTSWPHAPLAVIYADLMSVGDPRLSEVAQHIKSVMRERING